MKLDMSLNDWVMIFAVLFSPFLAVFAQRKIDLSREKRGQKLWVFRTLMATRGNKISLDHVQALNSIELFFNNPKSDKEIVEKWNEYLDHLIGQNLKQDDKGYSTKLAAWSEKNDDLLAELLQLMSKSLGYDFDKVKIKRGIYSPRGHGEEMVDHFLIRKKMVEMFSGNQALSVKIIDQDK